MAAPVPPIHPDVEPVTTLLGTWEGEGKGEFPTIQPFGYREEVRFWHAGKPFLLYTQRTWALDDGRPLHGEMGYWRLGQGGSVELVLAHPTGVAEVAEGRVEAVGTSLRISVDSTTVGLTSTAKQVDRLRRVLEVSGDELTYDLFMAAVGIPLTHHLRARLLRTAAW